jgi:SAM-dependent methyltransferase
MPDRARTLERAYDLRFAGSDAYRNRVWEVLCEVFFSRLVPSNSTLLDLGSGWGEFVNHIAAAKKYAMDLNPAGAARMSADVRFLHQDCTREWPIESGSLDVVFTSNFLEHLPDKPAVDSTIAEAARCLKEGGRIICLGPNIRYVHSAYWDFWDHQIPLTDASCSELLRLHGFEVDRCLPRFLPYTMSTGRRPSLSLVRLYLHLPVVWPLFGGQFLVVGRKGPKASGGGPS